MNYSSELKNELAVYLQCAPEDIILTWKGRVALYGMLKSLGIKKGDEIILPAYTCVVVPNAILYLNAKPVYVDIDPKTYNIDVSKIEKNITSKTKVIIAQNTYGLSSDVDAIQTLADKYDLKVLEDCTHGFGGTYKGVLNGKNVDAAFYSSQWNKMFSTGLGGITISSDPEMSARMAAFEKQLASPSVIESFVLKSQMIIKDLIGYSTWYWSALKFYRYLTRRNIILGSSSFDELDGIEMPDGYLKGYSEVQAKRALRELRRIDANIKHRQRIATIYDEYLNQLGILPPYAPDYAMHTYTKYPILVRDREYILSEAEQANLPVHDWFTTPLYPVSENLEKWHFDELQYPVAVKISQHVMNLPTDLLVTDNMAASICGFLKTHKKQLIDADDLFKNH